MTPTRQRWPWLIGLLAYGAAIEVLQSFTPNRQAEWGDLLADGLGIALGALLGTAWLRAMARTQARRGAASAVRAKP